MIYTATLKDAKTHLIIFSRIASTSKEKLLKRVVKDLKLDESQDSMLDTYNFLEFEKPSGATYWIEIEELEEII